MSSHKAQLVQKDEEMQARLLSSALNPKQLSLPKAVHEAHKVYV